MPQKWSYILYFILVLLKASMFPIACFGQDYAVWTYSSQKLDFNSEPPHFDSDNSIMTSYYSASLCDNKGKLKLFVTVDTAVHFLNSEGLVVGRTGNRPRKRSTSSRYRSGLLKLNDSLSCFLYTSDVYAVDTSYLKDSAGLFMTLLNSNNGLNQVLPINQDMRVSPLPLGGLTFRLNSDSTWWIISEYNDSLFAQKLLRNGTMLPPVATYLGELEIPQDNFILNPRQSTMRFSHDGRFFIRSAEWDMPLSYYRQSTVYAYTFNGLTGQFNNQVLIEKQILANTASGTLFTCTDVIFAPNDSFFYLVYTNHGLKKNVVQFNRHASNLTSSEYCIHYQDHSDWGGTVYHGELGQNAKIYLSASSSNYSIIYRPNLPKEKCTYLMNKMVISCNIDASGNGCSNSDFPYSRFHGFKMAFDYQMHCDSTLQVINLSDTLSLKKFSWYLYGPNNYLDSIEGTNPKFKVQQSGEYWLKFKGTTLSGYQPWFSDSIQVEFLDIPKAQFSLANTKGCQFVNFAINDGSTAQKIHSTNGQEWFWDFGDGTDTTINTGNSGDIQHIYTSIGNFIISLRYSNGYCYDTFTAISSVTIDDAPQPGIMTDNAKGCFPLVTLFSDKYSDPIDSVVFEFGDGQRYSSLNHLTNHPHIYTNPGTYNAIQSMYGSSGCVSQDSVEIYVLDGFAPNQALELAYTTLLDQHIETRWLQVPVAKYYALDRLDEVKNSWQRIYYGADTIFKEINVEPLLRYRYRVTAFDTCDKTIFSNEGSNIVLTGSNLDNTSSILSWNPYSVWRNGVKDYTLLKIDPLTGFGTPIIQANTVTYEDLDFFTIGNDSVCYQVVATSQANPDWFSNSNVACIRYIPTIWIPNSFSPDNNGLNELFKPVTMGVRDENYEFTIYDRWGAEIFRTTSKEYGWDGTFKSSPAQSGLYFYRLSYAVVDIQGKYSRLNVNGSILLIR